jgi:GntR family transcriptional regulator/MocR family aminotransferase
MMSVPLSEKSDTATSARARRSPASVMIAIDPRAEASLQQQVYAGVRRAILEGVVAPGTRLPSSRALARDLHLSRTTTLLALEQLLAEGYVTARRGSGTFVADELPDDLPRRRAARSSRELRHPPLSRRGAALAAIAPAARRVPGPPKPFRIGVPALDLFPVRVWAQLVGKRLRSVTAAQLDYGDSPTAVREAIAEHVSASRGTRCTAEQVLTTAGAKRAVDLVCAALLDAGDAAWMEEPGYQGTLGALVRAGARIVPVPVDADGLDVAAGERRAPHARLACVSPSHQFPLGVPMSLPRRLALLDWASRARAWIVEDDYDSEFRYGARPIPSLHGLDGDGRVIYVGSFSKTLFPSLRLGFLIAPPDLYESLKNARRAADSQPPWLDQAVLADFMLGGHYDRYLRRIRAACRDRLEALIDAAERHCKGALRLRPVRTGLHAVADLTDAHAAAVFEQAALRGVEVMPLSAYYLGRQKPPNALVLGFGAVRPDTLGRGMERLAAAIEAARRAPTRETS